MSTIHGIINSDPMCPFKEIITRRTFLLKNFVHLDPFSHTLLLNYVSLFINVHRPSKDYSGRHLSPENMYSKSII